MLDGSTIIHVADNLMGEGSLQTAAGLVELLELHGGEVVEVITVGTDEMTEDGTRYDGVLALQTADNLVNILLRVEAEAVHTRIEFDVYGPTRNTLLLSGTDEGIHQTERVDLWLEIVVEHRLEGRHLRVHNHNVLRNAVATQCDALVSNSHCEVVDTVVLQGLGNLHGTSAIGVGLDHADQFGLRLQEGAIVVEVVDQCVEVNLQNGLMDLLLQLFSDTVEAKGTGTLDEDDLVVQLAESIAGKESVCGGEEEHSSGKTDGHTTPRKSGCDMRTYADEFGDTTFQTEGMDLCIEVGIVAACLVDIAEDERAVISGKPLDRMRAARHEVKGDIEGIDVAIVRVVDEQAAMLTFLDFQTHRYWFKVGHALSQLLGSNAEVKRYCRTGERALQRCLVEERQLIVRARSFIYIVNTCMTSITSGSSY